MENKTNFSVEKANDSSGFLLWQVTTLWQREIKSELEKINLSHSAFVILASLLWFEEQKIIPTQTTIINHTKLDKMTVSKTLKQLVSYDFVGRFENENDTRAKNIVLTEFGRNLSIEAVQKIEKIDTKFFTKLSSDEKQTLNKLFLKLINE